VPLPLGAAPPVFLLRGNMNLKITADTWVGLAVLVFAGIVYYEAAQIPVSPLYARVGPAVFPYIVAAALAALGVALTIKGLRGGWSHEDPELTLKPDWRAVFWVALGLGINLATIADLGFTLASALMFACVSRCFGSNRPLADFGVGFALAAVAYLGFSVGLGINIGDGILEKLVF